MRSLAAVLDDGGRPAELAQLIGQRHLDERRQFRPLGAAEAARLALDLAEVLSRVPPELRELADALAEAGSVKEAARALGMSRSGVYRRLRRLRNVLHTLNPRKP
jgi:transcriptional regulator of acetoin/glycerol metabolism